jgi:hypothetical protein
VFSFRKDGRSGRHFRSPSPSVVVALVALFVTLVGTGYAAFSLPKDSVGSKQLKKGAVSTAKIKNGAVTKAKLNVTGVTVPNALHADAASTANSATNANHASTADTATNAQPVAFAHVSSAGTLDTANSKNIGSVKFVPVSAYCLSGIPFNPRGGQATVDFDDSHREFAQFGLGNGGGTCPAGTQVFVYTSTSSSGSPAGFFVHIYG